MKHKAKERAVKISFGASSAKRNLCSIKQKKNG